MTPVEALEKAMAVCGGGYELASKLNVRPQNVYSWKKGKVPAKHVLALEKVSGVPRHLFRPDIYPPSEYKRLK